MIATELHSGYTTLRWIAGRRCDKVRQQSDEHSRTAEASIAACQWLVKCCVVAHTTRIGRACFRHSSTPDEVCKILPQHHCIYHSRRYPLRRRIPFIVQTIPHGLACVLVVASFYLQQVHEHSQSSLGTHCLSHGNEPITFVLASRSSSFRMDRRLLPILSRSLLTSTSSAMYLLQLVLLTLLSISPAAALPSSTPASPIKKDGFGHSKTSVRLRKRALESRSSPSMRINRRGQRRRKPLRKVKRTDTGCPEGQDCIQYAPEGEQAVIPIYGELAPSETQVSNQAMASLES